MKIEYSGCKDTQKNVKSKIFPLIFFANVYVHRIFPKLKVFLGLFGVNMDEFWSDIIVFCLYGDFV